MPNISFFSPLAARTRELCLVFMYKTWVNSSVYKYSLFDTFIWFLADIIFLSYITFIFV